MHIRILFFALAAMSMTATAQVFTNLHNFSIYSGSNYTNTDGAEPNAGLILSSNILYGTAKYLGFYRNGTIFRVNTDGTAFTNLYNFTNSPDGANPTATLLLSGNTLYGTTYSGGTNGNGTIFKINTDGSGYSNLYSFAVLVNYTNITVNSTNVYSTNRDGANPYGGLVLSGNMLYGTALYGGRFGSGTIFGIGTNGLNFTNLHNFATLVNNTNSDGAWPYDTLVLSGGALYGTAYWGGPNVEGTVFAVSTNGGSSFTNLFFFNGGNGNGPIGGLTLSPAGDTLYGTTYSGGGRNSGVIFSLSTNGAVFNQLHDFQISDGANPEASLTLSGNTLYGTTINGGTWTNGTVFSINTNGNNFVSIYSFSAHDPTYYTNTDGFSPYGNVAVSGNMIYGSTYYGGIVDEGTLFSIEVAPQLFISLSGTNAILTWTTNAPGFSLQAATNLTGPIAWNSVSGQNNVTNPVSGSRKFYRLMHP